MIHYEILLLYAIGFTAKDIRKLGYSRGSVYRFRRIYRDAGKRLTAKLTSRNYDSPEGKHKPNNLDHLKKKKGRPPREKKPCYIRNMETGEYEEIFL